MSFGYSLIFSSKSRKIFVKKQPHLSMILKLSYSYTHAVQVPLVLGNCTSCGGEVSCADLPGPLTEAQCSSLEASDAHPIYVRSRRQPGVYSLRGFYLRDYRGGREGVRFLGCDLLLEAVVEDSILNRTWLGQSR